MDKGNNVGFDSAASEAAHLSFSPGDIPSLNAATGVQRDQTFQYHQGALSRAAALELGRVYAECFRAAPWNEDWSIDRAIAQLDHELAIGAGLLAVSLEGKRAGMVVAAVLSDYSHDNPRDGEQLRRFSSVENPYYLIDFAVEPTLQSRGLGTTLIGGLVHMAERAGCETIITRTKTDNVAAIRVFEKVGFTSLGYYDATTGGVTSQRVVFEIPREQLLRYYLRIP